ncbi:MAG: site-2 protease family protein, partial [Candidatus Methylomirabilis sp.]|nr:site-2 protease family protein [Deltaproteobacteria bacterium]
PDLAAYMVYGGAARVPMSAGLEFANFLARMCIVGLYWNVSLAIFNMIPIPPLDGGRVAVGLLPFRAARGLAGVEPVGIFLVILLFWVNPLGIFSGVFGFLRHSILDLLL